MSLIVASSSQQQYGGIERLGNVKTISGLEAPSNFQNHFTSPIKIPQNAEIAVESVKITRDALMDIEAEALMYMYFGRLQTTPNAFETRLEMPIPIKPRAGVYNVEEWRIEIETRLNESYANPEIFGKWVVGRATNGSGVTTNLTLKCTQRGQGAPNIAIQAGAMLSSYWVSPCNLSKPYKSGVDWTSVDAGAPGQREIERLKVGSKPSVIEELDEMSCSMIGHGHPFSLNEGEFIVKTKDAGAAGKGGWRVGLARPQMEYIRDTTKPTAARQRANLLPGTRHPDGGFPDGQLMSTKYNLNNPYNGRNQRDFYDFMVQNDSGTIQIFQLSYDDVLYTNQLVMSEVVYWGQAGSWNPAATGPMTTAEFNASFTAVEFKSAGDKMDLYFGVVGDVGGRVKMVGNALQTKRWECFLPIGETRNALYPRLNITQEEDILTITSYSSHYDALQFRYPTINGNNFVTGDDYYTNNRVMRYARAKVGGDLNLAVVEDTKNRPYCLSQTLLCDTKQKMVVDQTHASTQTTSYQPIVSKALGQKIALIIGHNEPGAKDDYLEGKYATGEFAGQAKMNRTLGFPNRSFVDQVEGFTQGYVVGDAPPAAPALVIQFNAFVAPEYRSHSCFVRLSNMPIQSYNGAKNSVSKILYHLPRFTNDGREFGTLFFAPGEKTYVALHNATPEILNNIEVQLVDVNERPVSDISGNTIVVFHLRKKV